LGEAHGLKARLSSLHSKPSAPVPPPPANANVASRRFFLMVALVKTVSTGSGSTLSEPCG
jgi:hypothetical protein